MIAKSLYGRDTAHLTEEEKQLVSTLGTLAAGLAGGVAGGDTPLCGGRGWEECG
ncbi:VENN motif pre-toxin domain-containing protein [Pluralibacter gergoviae]